MSDFISNMFSTKTGKRVPVMEYLGSGKNLDMTASGTELFNEPRILIEYIFKAGWVMKAAGSSKEYDAIHKIAIKALTRSVYGEFYKKLTDLELALYAHDVDRAKEIMFDIKKEVNL